VVAVIFIKPLRTTELKGRERKSGRMRLLGGHTGRERERERRMEVQ